MYGNRLVVELDMMGGKQERGTANVPPALDSGWLCGQLCYSMKCTLAPTPTCACYTPLVHPQLAGISTPHQLLKRPKKGPWSDKSSGLFCPAAP